MNTPYDDPTHTLPFVRDAALTLLAECLCASEEELDLGEAALRVALGHQSRLDIARYRSQLDDLATEAQRRIGRTRRPERLVAILNELLFSELGFQGDQERYYDPANSFLPDVLERRVGLPITLSVLYLAITHRLGLPVYGVGMPLHFLVKYQTPGVELFVDPFHGGGLLTREDCERLFARIAQRSLSFEPRFLDATPKRHILYRMLNNLKQVYLQREEVPQAGRIVEQMLVVLPNAHTEVRDRGLLALQENAYSQGILWLHCYLARQPNAPDRAQMAQAIERACERRARLN